MRQGLAAWRATGAELWWPSHLVLLAEVYGRAGQVEEGLSMLAEALSAAHKSGERFYEAEMYRLKGELTLAQSRVQSLASRVQTKQKAKGKGEKESHVHNSQSAFRDPQLEAEACFQQAIAIARRQSAKSLELRVVVSLARLWQSQGKEEEAHRMLAEIYGWFTEGFDTADLREAKTLLDELG
jgi:predicted ATPase